VEDGKGRYVTMGDYRGLQMTGRNTKEIESMMGGTVGMVRDCK